LKKQLQNEKRRGSEEVEKGKRGKAEERGESEERRSQSEMSRGSKLGVEMVLYLAMVIELIEEHRVSREEIEELVVRVMRQHSIARRRRMDYVVSQLNRGPP